jgi:hypothetical protein
MKAAALAVGCVLAVASAARAEEDSGKYRSDLFANSCRKAVELDQGKLNPSIPDAVSIADCYGYIQGFIDGHNMTADHAGNSKQFCVPAGVAAIQVARLVVNASDSRPDIGHLHRESLLEYALASAWPCSAGGA